MKLFAVSDLHVDFPENWAWCEAISARDHLLDAIILAGDVTDSIALLQKTFVLFKSKFKEVFFVPGNHDVWITRHDSGKFADSVQKLQGILSLCSSLNVRTAPAKLKDKVWVVPLYSWYHPELDDDTDSAQFPIKGWSDFTLCKWPATAPASPFTPSIASSTATSMEISSESASSLNTLSSISTQETVPLSTSISSLASEFSPLDYFLNLNGDSLARKYDRPVITFSHFLPRRELLPPRKVLFVKYLPKVAGTKRLDEMLRQIGSRIHVFGHSHINWDQTISGVRYVQLALRYPSERKQWYATTNLTEMVVWQE